jgi:LacI family transcriptional regulator
MFFTICQQGVSNMPPKHRRVTLEDVAREAGVSPMTVSRVINNTGRISEATRAQVRAVIARLDYRPSRAARTLVTRKTFLIGLVVPDITNPYFAEIVQGAETVAWERAYSVLLANTNENPAREEAVLGQLDDSTIDGLIVCSSRLPDDMLLPLIEQHSAVVVINRAVPTHVASVVRNRMGYFARAVLALDHLIASGHRRIGYLCLRHSAVQLSLERYMTKLEAEGLEVDPDWYRICAPTWAAGYEQGRSLLRAHPTLDAIACGNDLIALGVMRAALDSGRHIPGDLAVTGGDDILLASQVTPTLTTFGVPKYEVGAMAMDLLFKRIDGDTTYREHLYSADLIVRESAP